MKLVEGKAVLNHMSFWK